MAKPKKPLFTNDFLNELAEEISQLYDKPGEDQNNVQDMLKDNDMK